MFILANMALSPVNNSSLLISKTVRVVLKFHDKDQLAVIEASPRISAGRYYFTAPFFLKLSLIETELEANILSLHESGLKQRPDVIASDEALNKKYQKSPCKCVIKRNERFSVIQALVPNFEDYELFLEAEYRNRLIREYLKKNQKDPNSNARRSVEQLIFQFLAEGSTRNSLTPYLAMRGGRGKERQQTQKLGRQNAFAKAGMKQKNGFVMQKKDKEHCQHAFQHFLKNGNTIEEAMRKMWREFYADPTLAENGEIKMVLWAKHLRPTRAQFVRWGSLYSHESVWQKQYNTQQLARLNRPLTGKANDGIIAVGQLGAIDSTTTDTEFVSVTNRLKRVGQAHRILLVDSLYGYIPGFCMGLEAASAQTVNLAILHAATNKQEWLEQLGLEDEIDANDWLSIQFGQLNADNTDARNLKNMQEQNSLGTGINYVPTHRSDMNASVESAHKMLHRAVDHKQSGTTRGKRLVRGDTRPDFLARLTVIEGIRNTARAIHYHNTRPLDIPLTLEMRHELVDKGLIVNRLNLTRMAMQQGKVHSALSDFDQLITTLGTVVKGTFTAEGVKLHRTDQKQRSFIQSVRYTSKNPFMLERFKAAKINRRGSPLNFDEDFFCNPYLASKIYYRDSHNGAVYPLVLQSNEEEKHEYTLFDYQIAMVDDAVAKHINEDKRQQQLSDLEDTIEQTNIEAERAYQDQLTSSPHISKSKITRDKKANRKQEKQLFKEGFTKDTQPEVQEKANTPPNEHEEPIILDATFDILDNLIKGSL